MEPSVLRYRNDINGLRAIGAIIILLGHFNPRGLFPSAFLAIDLFFVISGYLITSIIIRDLRSGHFSFLKFYIRRTLRIFPAILIVLAAVTVVGYFWMLTDEFSLLGRHIAAASLFLSNFVLSDHVGYFDVASEKKVLLHFWSMALEEQFYLVIPLIIWTFHRLSQLRHLKFLFAAGIVISLFVYCRMIPEQQDQAYFLPQSRVWELLIGCLLGTFRLQFRSSKYLNLISGLSLAAMIFLFQQSWTFRYGAPLLAFLTTVLTAVVLMSEQSSVNKNFLTWKPFVYLGLISYPLYLWHWPLLVFYRIFYNERLPSNSAFVILVGLTLILSALTYHLIERPSQCATSKKRTAAACVVLLGFLGIVGQGIYKQAIPPKNDTTAMSAITSARLDRDLSYRSSAIKSVVHVGKSQNETLFVGDSVIEQYYPRVKKLIEKNTDLSASFITTGGCPPIPGIFGVGGFNCSNKLNTALEESARSDIRTVVIGASWATYFVDKGTFYWFKTERDLLDQDGVLKKSFEEFEKYVASIGKGKKVFIVASPPVGHAFDPLSMIDRHFPFGRPERTPTVFDRAIYEERLKPVTEELKRIAHALGAELIDPMESLCDTRLCPTTLGGEPIYRDDIHMRATYARDHADYIDHTLGHP